MFSFAISLALIPYAVCLAIIGFFAFFTLKNLILYRAEDTVAFFAAFIFLAGLVFIGYVSYQYLAPVNWDEVIVLNLIRNGF